MDQRQILRSEKRIEPGVTNAIYNVTLYLQLWEINWLIYLELVIFQKNKFVSRSKHSQWMLYQSEEIPEEYSVKKEVEESSTSGNSWSQESYWNKALEVCGILLLSMEFTKYKQIDEYWAKILPLFCLVKCILSFSHGNSVTERGFSINRIMLGVHGYMMKENTIVALWFVKDELFRVGGILNFNITRSNRLHMKRVNMFNIWMKKEKKKKKNRNKES